MSSPLLPLFEKEESGDVQVRFGPLPLYFGPIRSSSKLYGGKGRVVLSSSLLTFFTCSLPTAALFLCVVISLYTDFDEATETHCGVANVLPSISTAISQPSTSSLWRLLIYLHTPGRLLALGVYLRWLPRNFLGVATRLCYIVEISSLLSLTYFDSDYNHAVHVFSFSSFGIFSIVHMFLHIKVVSDITSRASSRLKHRWMRSAMVCIISVGVLFTLHNGLCWPYLFSIFAFFEYSFVVSNILFHSTFRLDFPDSALFLF